MISVRQARIEELPELRKYLDATVELTPGRVWIALDGEKTIGILPLRLCWQAEPLLLLPSANKLPKVSRSRASLMMYLAAETWIASPLNRVGPRWLFAITRSNGVRAWSRRLGWRQIYKNASMFIKHL